MKRILLRWLISTAVIFAVGLGVSYLVSIRLGISWQPTQPLGVLLLLSAADLLGLLTAPRLRAAVSRWWSDRADPGRPEG